jgi:hypothetical protein
MSKHKAPTIYIDQLRFDMPLQYDFIELHPDSTGHWNHQPLGTAQPKYSETSVRCNEETARQTRDYLTDEGFEQLPWREMPEYLRAWVIEYIVPVEFKPGLRTDDESFTSRYLFWVNGDVPASRYDREQEAV